jgi:hypothetical protein
MILSFKYQLLFLMPFLFLSACKPKSTDESSAVSNENTPSPVIKKYDWTGTYQLKDKEEEYTLKLHKRTVDGSYEMLFYNNNKLTNLFKSSIYDAKEDSSNISIRFLNNFQMDAKPLGFKSGDTLFILQHREGMPDSSIYKSFHPATKGSNWIKTSDHYN